MIFFNLEKSINIQFFIVFSKILVLKILLKIGKIQIFKKKTRKNYFFFINFRTFQKLVYYRNSTEEGRAAQVLRVLSRSFSRRPMTEAVGEVLTASEAVTIMATLTGIYKESLEEDVSGKALSLITILMDSHGSRIVYEDKLHQKFAEISNFVIEMVGFGKMIEKN